jgi:hypothetical protein
MNAFGAKKIPLGNERDDMIKAVHPFNQALCSFSSETVKRFLPLFLRAAITLRPLAEAMRSRKPCLFLLFLFEGWYVLFIAMATTY